MNTLTHDEIAKLADQLWRNQKCPAGRDAEFWFEAERKLSAKAKNEVENELPSAQPNRKSIKAATKKERARAPQVAQHSAHKTTPPETGKPLWPQEHSS